MTQKAKNSIGSVAHRKEIASSGQWQRVGEDGISWEGAHQKYNRGAETLSKQDHLYSERLNSQRGDENRVLSF